MEEKLSELEMLFRNVYRRFREQFNSLINEYVTTNEFIVLKLMRKGEKRVTDLSKILQVSASHITSLTDSLVQKNLIERQRSNKDRRVIELSLTNEGIELINRLSKVNSQFLHDKFNVLSEKEKTNLIELLKKLEDQLYK